MPVPSNPLRLQTETQPGKPRDPFLYQQARQIEDAINSLSVQGVVSVVRDYVVGVADYWILVDTTNGGVVVTLPDATVARHSVGVKKIDGSGNSVTVVTISGQLIDGAGSKVIATQWNSLIFVPYFNNAPSGVTPAWYLFGGP